VSGSARGQLDISHPLLGTITNDLYDTGTRLTNITFPNSPTGKALLANTYYRIHGDELVLSQKGEWKLKKENPRDIQMSGSIIDGPVPGPQKFGVTVVWK
jgi:hypothetical protein